MVASVVYLVYRLFTFGLVEGQRAGEVLVDDGGDVAGVVREHDAVGADVLRTRTRAAALALRLRRAAAWGHGSVVGTGYRTLCYVMSM